MYIVSADGHLGIFTQASLRIVLVLTWIYSMCSLGKYLIVIVCCLPESEVKKLYNSVLSTVAESTLCSPRVVQGPYLLHHSIALAVYIGFDCNHPGVYEAVLHYSFDLHFPGD